MRAPGYQFRGRPVDPATSLFEGRACVPAGPSALAARVDPGPTGRTGRGGVGSGGATCGFATRAPALSLPASYCRVAADRVFYGFQEVLSVRSRLPVPKGSSSPVRPASGSARKMRFWQAMPAEGRSLARARTRDYFAVEGSWGPGRPWRVPAAPWPPSRTRRNHRYRRPAAQSISAGELLGCAAMPCTPAWGKGPEAAGRPDEPPVGDAHGVSESVRRAAGSMGSSRLSAGAKGPGLAERGSPSPEIKQEACGGGGAVQGTGARRGLEALVDSERRRAVPRQAASSSGLSSFLP